MKDYNKEYFYVEKKIGAAYPYVCYMRGGGNYTEVDKGEALEDITTERIVGYSGDVPEKPELGIFMT